MHLYIHVYISNLNISDLKVTFSFIEYCNLVEILNNYTGHIQKLIKFDVNVWVMSTMHHQTYSEPYNEDAVSQYHAMDGLAEELRLAEAYYRGGDQRAAADLATSLLETSPWAAQLRQLRAECYIAMVSILFPIVNRLIGML